MLYSRPTCWAFRCVAMSHNTIGPSLLPPVVRRTTRLEWSLFLLCVPFAAWPKKKRVTSFDQLPRRSFTDRTALSRCSSKSRRRRAYGCGRRSDRHSTLFPIHTTVAWVVLCRVWLYMLSHNDFCSPFRSSFLFPFFFSISRNVYRGGETKQHASMRDSRTRSRCPGSAVLKLVYAVSVCSSWCKLTAKYLILLFWIVANVSTDASSPHTVSLFLRSNLFLGKCTSWRWPLCNETPHFPYTYLTGFNVDVVTQKWMHMRSQM